MGLKPTQLRCNECKSRRNLVQFTEDVYGLEAYSVLCESHYMNFLEANLLQLAITIGADKTISKVKKK